MDATELSRLQKYFREKFGSEAFSVRGRPKKDDSAEVYFSEEFVGVLFRDEDDDCYQFQMAILDEDMPSG
ncbi:MAG: DUF3126 family protein [Pseudomonadota bacterium]